MPGGPGYDRFGRLERFVSLYAPKRGPEFADRLKADIERRADEVKSTRVVVQAVVEGEQAKRSYMSLLGKLNALTERAAEFTKSTEEGLDKLADKIISAETKREEALAKHNGYYDAIVKGIDESVKVIDRLSNGPLDGLQGGSNG